GDGPRLLALLAERDEVDVERGERPRPGDPVLVGGLLDRGGDDPRRADPVGAHPDRVLGAVLVEVARAERLGVTRPELEDVADLDRRLDPDRAAVGAAVASGDVADVAPVDVEVAARLDAAQVAALLVGPG